MPWPLKSMGNFLNTSTLSAVWSMESTVRDFICQWMPKVTQTEFRVDQVAVSLLHGTLELRGVEIGNPQEFGGGTALRCSRLQVGVDRRSLARQNVLIHQVAVEGLQMFYHTDSNAQSNVKRIFDNVFSFLASSAEAFEPERYRIKHLSVEFDKVLLPQLDGPSKEISKNLPPIHLPIPDSHSSPLASDLAIRRLAEALVARGQNAQARLD